jgi:hypothetical protein
LTDRCTAFALRWAAELVVSIIWLRVGIAVVALLTLVVERLWRGGPGWLGDETHEINLAADVGIYHLKGSGHACQEPLISA